MQTKEVIALHCLSNVRIYWVSLRCNTRAHMENYFGKTRCHQEITITFVSMQWKRIWREEPIQMDSRVSYFCFIAAVFLKWLLQTSQGKSCQNHRKSGKSAGRAGEFKKNVEPGQGKSGKIFLSKYFVRVRKLCHL